MLISHLGPLRRLNHTLPLHKEVPSRSLRQGKVLNRDIPHLCRTTILTRKISTTVPPTILVMGYPNLSSSTRQRCFSLVLQALDLHPHLQRRFRAPRPFPRNRILMVRVYMVNNTHRLATTNPNINTTPNNTSTSTAMRRMPLTCPRMNMESISSSFMVHKACKALWVLDRARDRLRDLH